MRVWPKIKHKWTNGSSRYRTVGLVGLVVVFVTIGVITLLATHAATRGIDLEPEKGRLSNSVKIVTNPQASGGQAIQFAAAQNFGDAVLIPAYKIALLKDAVAKQIQPNYAAWLQVKDAADAALTHAPTPPAVWLITASTYTDPAAYEAQIKPLRFDAYDTYMLGLAYQITGNAAYATQADKFIKAWSATTTFLSSYTAFSLVPWVVYFPGMIFGADMVRSSAAFTASDQSAFSAFLTRSISAPMTVLAYHNTNNQGVWGVACVTATAVYLKDKTLFNTMVARYKSIQDAALNDKSVPTQEVRRQGGGQGDGSSGLAYSNFVMMAMTYAAEIMNTQGVNVYDYVSPNGANLHTLYNLVTGWSANPSTFPFNTSGTVSTIDYWNVGPYEILNGRWPTPKAQAILDTYRPVRTAWSVHAPSLIWGGGLGVPY